MIIFQFALKRALEQALLQYKQQKRIKCKASLSKDTGKCSPVDEENSTNTGICVHKKNIFFHGYPIIKTLLTKLNIINSINIYS